ncbi:16S rRNA (guanine(527)-N(7))-methyltransferase RsmG [Aurantimonas sp. A2-1-M11]|uniref:16S rRNA (guanine(527)-N(7))-methyltransferase RsmG n=1 Tax=Aurantimonas sp. A2-1-M11 TaxID=3113712 RepID=UPI002F9481CF
MRRDRDSERPARPYVRPPQTPPRRRPRAADVAAAQEAGRAEFLASHDVSRETLDRLDRYVALLTDWQKRINLIAQATIGDVWTRHVADSLELERHLPQAATCVDLGSGAGLPGIIVAASRPQMSVDLIEANAKKIAFLRAAQRELGLKGTAHGARIEDCGPVLAGADIVTARALASLSDLFALVTPHIRPGTRCFFQKGRNHEQEINAATAHWRFRVIKHETTLEDGSVVLELDDIAPL